MKICITENCNSKVKARGLCQYHYHKLLYPTNADRGANKKEDIDYNDFWEFVKKELRIRRA